MNLGSAGLYHEPEPVLRLPQTPVTLADFILVSDDRGQEDRRKKIFQGWVEDRVESSWARVCALESQQEGGLGSCSVTGSQSWLSCGVLGSYLKIHCSCACL